MTPTHTLLVLNVVLVALAMRHVARTRGPWKRDAPAPRPESAGADNSVDAIVRIARFGDRSLAEQTRILVRVAPPTDRRAVVELSSAFDGGISRVDVEQVAAARGWTDGRPSFAVGDLTMTERTLKPLSRAIAGWELELVTSGGDVLRCYGRGDDAIAGDLLRLRRLIGFRPAGCSAGSKTPGLAWHHASGRTRTA
jgi:hypothetical protein